MHTRKVAVIFLLFWNLICVFTDENNDSSEEDDYSYDTDSSSDTDSSNDTDSYATVDVNGTHYSINEIDNSPALRIVNGRAAKKNEIKYQISFKRKLNWKKYYSFCGGTLITRRNIISAAHCFVKVKACDFCSKGKVTKADLKHYWAVAGNLRTTDSKPSSLGSGAAAVASDKGQWKKLESLRYPNSYMFPEDDICFLTLETPMVLNDAVKPIPYAKKPFPIEGKECTASGYGRLSITGSKQSPTRLQVAKLKVWTKAQCTKFHRKNMDKYICTSHSKSDVAEGDSGGPLVCENAQKKKYLVGVVCGRTTFGRKRRRRGRGRRWRLQYVNRGHGGKHGQHGSYFTRVTSFTQFLAGKDGGPRTDDGPALIWLCFFVMYSLVS